MNAENSYSIDQLKTIIGPIAEKYGVSDVYMFGSYARGEATAESDIDFRINSENMTGLFALCGFCTDIEKALNMNADVVTTPSLSEDFLKSIAGDEVLIYAK